MKKFLKLSLIIVSIMLLLLSNYCYATESVNSDTEVGIPPEWARTLDPDMSAEDMILDGANEVLYNSNENDGIMPINDNIEIPSNVTDSDVYLIQENISIEGDVNGNVYVIGKKVNVSSDYLNGNVFVIGQDVTIRGVISGSIYVIGENVNIEAESVNIVYALGKNVNLAENANILGDLKVSAGNLNISGNIIRELDAYIDNINIAESAEYIGKGNVSYSGEISDPKSILETLSVTKHEKTEEKAETVKSLIIANKVKSEVITIISTIIVIGVMYLIIRNRQTEKLENYPQEIITGACKGFLWLIVTPIVSLILICTIIGIPLALLALTIYIVGICISIPIASLRIAEIIFTNNPNKNKSIMLLYAIAVYVALEVISLIPTIGGLIRFLVTLYGLESLIKYIFPSKNKKVNKENKENEVIIEENK